MLLEVTRLGFQYGAQSHLNDVPSDLQPAVRTSDVGAWLKQTVPHQATLHGIIATAHDTVPVLSNGMSSRSDHLKASNNCKQNSTQYLISRLHVDIGSMPHSLLHAVVTLVTTAWRKWRAPPTTHRPLHFGAPVSLCLGSRHAEAGSGAACLPPLLASACLLPRPVASSNMLMSSMALTAAWTWAPQSYPLPPHLGFLSCRRMITAWSGQSSCLRSWCVVLHRYPRNQNALCVADCTPLAKSQFSMHKQAVSCLRLSCETSFIQQR